MEKNYTCKMKKEEILKTIVAYFEEVHSDLDNVPTDKIQARNYYEGKYSAMYSLLEKIKISEK